ncbi:MAG: TIGR02221 family CRISPR-associated protein [Pontiella sp.]
MNVLIMTLGKGRKEDSNRYQTACYQFSDGNKHVTSFFGLALFRWLQEQACRIDRVVILGTTGSSWDAILELCGEGGTEVDELYYQVASQVENVAVTQELLGKIAELSSTIFPQTEVVCRLIPSATDCEGQYEILSTIANHVPEGAHLWMDLTHGFRHLPLLELMSGFNLEEAKGIELKGLFYGIFEQTKNGITPAIELPFARELSRWTRAIHAVDHGQLGALIGLSGMEAFDADLKKLLLYEQLNQLSNARKAAKNILSMLEKPLPSHAGELFRKKLRTHFEWSHGQTYAIRQLQSAEKAISQRDYIHGVILMNEALISNAIPQGSDTLRFSVREKAAGTYCKTDDHHLLRILRNTLAHGTRPQGKQAAKIMHLMDNPEHFHQEMLRLLRIVKKEWDA